ncbi:MAG: TlpA family protein disulfide reductase [Methylotenera sp.]|uniref:TlpA disulfide reductase family protein n=1 Tax=Methylotenera sp. TaxID=2051956 RepID=UPI0017A165AA|nr:TlpA disulfide reductase family protein [Methylotenera sp.]NOU23938.1 TlpA family protein disulfide reductase [Methylotenera sp.]
MLKKIVSNITYFVVMLGLGYVIYAYFLIPNLALNRLNEANSTRATQTLSTQTFFAAKLPNENGVLQDLSQFKGKVVVLNFWATWCPPCREEMPELSELQAEYKNKNVAVIGIAIDELNLVKEFSESTPVGYPLLADENEGMSLADQLGNDKGVLPYTVIINSDGTVAKTYFGRITKPLLVSTLSTLLPP